MMQYPTLDLRPAYNFGSALFHAHFIDGRPCCAIHACNDNGFSFFYMLSCTYIRVRTRSGSRPAVMIGHDFILGVADFLCSRSSFSRVQMLSAATHRKESRSTTKGDTTALKVPGRSLSRIKVEPNPV